MRTPVLHSLAALAGAPPSLLVALAREFTAIVDDRAFPCVFAPVPFSTGELHFGLLPEPAGPVEDQVVGALRELCALVRVAPDTLAVLFVEESGPRTLADDFELASRIVRTVMRRNELDHPGVRFPHPDEPHWELLLDGVGLFLNFSSPRHVARRSRNVGPCFTIIAQERKSFDRRDRGTQQVRDRIRDRLARYDDVPPHPSLGHFGDPDSREVLQLFLGDGSQPLDPSGTCLRAQA